MAANESTSTERNEDSARSKNTYSGKGDHNKMAFCNNSWLPELSFQLPINNVLLSFQNVFRSIIFRIRLCSSQYYIEMGFNRLCTVIVKITYTPCHVTRLVLELYLILDKGYYTNEDKCQSFPSRHQV